MSIDLESANVKAARMLKRLGRLGNGPVVRALVAAVAEEIHRSEAHLAGGGPKEEIFGASGPAAGDPAGDARPCGGQQERCPWWERTFTDTPCFKRGVPRELCHMFSTHW